MQPLQLCHLPSQTKTRLHWNQHSKARTGGSKKASRGTAGYKNPGAKALVNIVAIMQGWPGFFYYFRLAGSSFACLFFPCCKFRSIIHVLPGAAGSRTGLPRHILKYARWPQSPQQVADNHIVSSDEQCTFPHPPTDNDHQ